MMKQILHAVLLIILLPACQNDSTTYTPGMTSKEPAIIEVDEMLTESEIEAFMQRWLKVCNTHTYDTYIKMYDSELFVGVKRPLKAKKSTYNYDGWISNKRSEFKNYKPEIIMNSLKVTQLNKDGRSKVSFEQVWISYEKKYADKGEKIMTLRKINGEIKIVYEELLYSEPADEYLYINGC
jgi:hypothetical protein